MPPTKRQWVRTNLQMTVIQHRELKRLANKKMITLADLIRRGIDIVIDQEKAKR